MMRLFRRQITGGTDEQLLTLSQVLLYQCVVYGAYALAGGGILLAGFVKPGWDGGWGGALAVALAFRVLFVRRDYGQRTYDYLTKMIPLELAAVPESERVAQTWALVEANNRRYLADAYGQRIQNVALTKASVIGTLAWGFGERMAGGLRLLHLHH